MSRSRKRTPYSGDKKNKFMKKYANRRLRRKTLSEMPLQHKSYKKDTCSYDICDYKTVGISFQQFWAKKLKLWHAWGYLYYPYPNKDEAYQEYLKYYKRK